MSEPRRYGEKHCCGALASGSGECEGESDFGIHSSRSEFLCRLKNLFGNLENIGYFKEYPCIFNIDSMEEFASIIACGGNAISKRYYPTNNRIERFANVKNIPDYISRIDEMIDKKCQLFK